MNVVLMLCIAMMCTTPFEVQGQNRRTGGGNSGSVTKKEQSSSKSSVSQGAATRSTQSAPRAVTPSGQNRPSTPARTGSGSSVTRQSGSSSSTPIARPQQQTRKTQSATQPRPSGQVQDRRSTNVAPNGSGSHSARISRQNSEVGRQNIPKQREARPSNAPGNRPGATIRPKGDPRPSVQYHNRPPRPRGSAFDRPFLEPRHIPMPSYRYGDHYFGHRLHTLPRGYTMIHVGGLDYYYLDGIYYRPYRAGGYYVCRPPLGTRIASTLFNVALTAIAINTLRNEVERAQRAATLSRVYATTNTGYVVRTSDDYYNTNLVGQLNQDYYYQDGVFYILNNGEYYVIEPPIGALVTQIPTDYDEIELDGRTYYLVENTLYKTTVIDGALYFEVVSNL